MNRKTNFTKTELSMLCSALANDGFIPPYDKIVIGYDGIINKYQIGILKGNEIKRITLATKKVVDVTKCTKQLNEFFNIIKSK